MRQVQKLMYHTYLLKSLKTNRLYIGSTEDLERRVAEHDAGYSKSTKSSRPFELIYSESYNTRPEAYNREMYFKTGKGREELKQILGNLK